MGIRSELNNLKEADLWSLILFVLYKVKDIPEYSGISELAYILDKKNLLKFCEYFGGCTITVPTVKDLELMLYALLLYEYVDIEKVDYEEAVSRIESDVEDITLVKIRYNKMKETLENYSFESRVK